MLSIGFSTTAGTFDESNSASGLRSTRDPSITVTLRGNGQAVVASVTITVKEEDADGRTGASRTTVRFGSPDV
jgi:hypothetical protein